MAIIKSGDRCSYSGKGNFGYFDFATNINKKKFKSRKRIKCPECGRRVWAKMRFTTEKDFMVFLMPPHKKKMWWKKKE